VEELALARACADGQERAWEIFMARYREKLYDIAGYIAKESSAARELADSLYADLYGTTTRDGKRISKLASYTGRGSLEGWLRTVMAQEFVNRFRRQRRLVSLDEESLQKIASFWHLIISMAALWLRSGAHSRCMNPPSAASSINWRSPCANKSFHCLNARE
jgi:DNA-directed RNA polymerase specialized sigma24 family protein